jgi:hypothetical protein
VFINILKKIKNFQKNNNNIKKSKKSKKSKISQQLKKSFLDPQHVISSLNFAC